MILRSVKKYWWICLLTSLMVIAETVVDLLQPALMADIIDLGVLKGDLQVIISLGIRMIIIVLFGAAAGILGSIFGNMAGQNTGRDIREALFEKTMHLKVSKANEFTAGSLINRLSDDVTRVSDSVKVAFRGIARYAFMLFGGIFMLYKQAPVFALVAVCSLPFLGFLIFFFLGRSSKMFSKVQKKLDKVTGMMHEDVAGARVIKAFGREKEEDKKFSGANEELYASSLKGQEFLAHLTPLMNIVLNLCVAAIILIGNFSIESGSSISAGRVMAAITYFTIILTGASVLGNLSQTFIRAKASWARIKEVLESGSEEEGEDTPEYAADAPALEFKNVCFSYPESAGYSLENISFKVNKGETLGIIGPTGSGKTTLINLIPRFFDPETGSISIEGEDIRKIPLNELRKKTAVVFQESELFARSIKENIRWGSEGASDEDIEKAARIAQAMDFIIEMPSGMDEEVTEGGHSLSGGQKQRIAIARAILKEADILIMDDATSALDIRTEARLYEALEEEYPLLTKIIVAQRIQAVMNADIVLVMDNGRIAAQGKHEELLASSPIYREIYSLQMETKGGARLG